MRRAGAGIITIDPSTFTPEEAAIYAASYLEGLRDGKQLQSYAEHLVQDLGQQIDELRKDVTYWQRIANAPTIAGDLTPRTNRLAAIATRQETTAVAFRQQRRPWHDARTRTIAAGTRLPRPSGPAASLKFSLRQA